MSEVHAQARTTPRTRTEIKQSSASLVELAERYDISVATARKWKQRDSPEDLSHRPHKLCTTLAPAQEAIVVALRRLALLPLDDLVAVVREFINTEVSRSGLDRCLRRHGVANLRQQQAEALADAGEIQPSCQNLQGTRSTDENRQTTHGQRQPVYRPLHQQKAGAHRTPRL